MYYICGMHYNNIGDMITVDFRVGGNKYSWKHVIVLMKYREMFKDYLIHSAN